MNRRKFLQYAGGALAGLALAGVPGCSDKEGLESKLTQANKTLREFPKEIPGAKSINKYETPGAEYCLIHVIQEHKLSSDVPDYEYEKSLRNNEKTWERLNNIQKDIYAILEDLGEKKIINSVYLEGMTKELWGTVTKGNLLELIIKPENKELEEEIKGLKRESGLIQWDLPEGTTLEQYQENNRNKIKEKEKELEEFREKYKFMEGGAMRLVYDGKISPRFEDSVVLNNSKEHMDRKSETFIEYVLDAREDSMLNQIASNQELVVATSFGGNHSWGGGKSFKDYDRLGRDFEDRDNIYEWNEAHPDKKFSLIEITPESYD